MTQPTTAPRPNRPPNRLGRESSPYLLQHAHNPVDWWPWGPEAFAEARRRDVPIFLSIGYSTCYWCHVMERESFESEAIARRMNERFVCVKVDREERPDVDDIYMAAVQIMTGHGGWPMSVFLEPASLKPYWCGTYFPPEPGGPGGGMPSFPQVLDAMSRVWRERREEVLKQAEAVGEAVREQLGGAGAAPHEPRPVGGSQVGQAISALLTTHDRVRGGFGGAPKFPQPSYVELLLRFLPFAGDPESRAAAEAAVRLTLDRMAVGGVFDQAGGGFHRYSVDAEWTVPHFEKMLYDNAMLAGVYARASRELDDPWYARIARRTLDYVRREMTDAAGGFHSAQDAEVDGREGLNYLWTADEVRAAAPGDDGELAVRAYGLDRGPNFRDPHHPEAPPANVLRLDDRPERVAAQLGMEPGAFQDRLDRANAALLAARATRKPPRQDDKVLAGWNGLMIGAMAAASATGGLREPAYRDAAARAADFILGPMRTTDGGLLRSWRAGAGSVPAFLEDYASVISGLVELHRVTEDSAGRYLAAAADLARVAAAQFGDGRGGYYDTRAEQADLFVRTRSTYDGAVPCGSSLMLNALIDLHEATGLREHLDAATKCLASISHAIAASPVATSHATLGLLRLLTIDAAAVAAAVPGRPAEPAADRAGFTPVVVLASTERVQVPRGEPAGLTLRLRIADGYHINAADPGPGGGALIALRVGVTGGGGVQVFADYPKGEAIDGPTGRIFVHRGEFELPVVLERPATEEWSGRPLLTVTYQACTDTECLAPTTVELDVALDPAG